MSRPIYIYIYAVWLIYASGYYGSLLVLNDGYAGIKCQQTFLVRLSKCYRFVEQKCCLQQKNRFCSSSGFEEHIEGALK